VKLTNIVDTDSEILSLCVLSKSQMEVGKKHRWWYWK